MRLLILDSNKFKYKLNHKTKVGEEVSEEEFEQDYNNPLTIFITIEEKDAKDMLERVEKDIVKIASENNSQLILLNPFAHLSSKLAKPELAIKLLDQLYEKLIKYKQFKVIRSVFCWYKEFLIDVKGHNNSQIYREY
jgi:threonyl-tRNA synthetase